jgi:hypothetical protein
MMQLGATPPVYSMTPRLKATHKSPMLVAQNEAPKRANSLFDQDLAFMTNQDFMLQLDPGFYCNNTVGNPDHHNYDPEFPQLEG